MGSIAPRRWSRGYCALLDFGYSKDVAARAHVSCSLLLLAGLTGLTGLTTLTACEPLAPIPANTCGNGVVEPGEDCDRFVTELGEGLVCAAPGEAHACLYVCAAPSGGCPSGWSCGGDGACRAASGRFEETVGSPVALESEAFAAGDADGDGLVDLLGWSGARLTVAYGAREGGWDGRLELDVGGRTAAPRLTPLDEDDVADLVVPLELGLFVALGRRDRTFAPVATPERELEAPGLGAGDPVHVLPLVTRASAPLHQLLWIGSREGGPNLSLSFDPEQTSELSPLRRPELERLAGRPATGDLDGDGVEELVLGFAGEQRLSIFTSTCAAPPPARCMSIVREYEARPEIVLPAPLEDAGVVLLDADGDGAIDVLARVSRGGAGSVALARGGRAGSLEREATESPELAVLVSTFGWPLASADLDADGASDVITPGAAIFGPLLGFDASRVWPLPGPSTDAVAGDLNLDGLGDFAIAGPTSGVSLYLGTGTAYFNLLLISTTSKVAALRSGDFDGDLVPDLAIVEAIPGPGDRAEARLSISYGGRDGGRTRPVQMGTFDQIQRIEAGLVRGADLIFDLVVEGAGPGGAGPRTLTVLAGNGLRRMTSPLALHGPGQELGDRPEEVHLGRFGGGDEAPDLLAPARSGAGAGAFGLWLARGQGTAAFDPEDLRFLVAPEEPPACVAVLERGRPALAHADLEGDGAEELIAVATAEDGTRLVILHVAEVAEEATLECEVLLLERPVPVDMVTIADLDADGVLDLLLGAGASSVSPGGALAALAGAVVFGDPSLPGGFDPRPAEVAVDVGVTTALPIALNADADPALELLIPTADGVFVSNLSGRTFDRPTAAAFSLATVPFGPLVTLDLDRDGLTDLAYGDGQQVHVLRSVPRAEVDGDATVEVSR